MSKADCLQTLALEARTCSKALERLVVENEALMITICQQNKIDAQTMDDAMQVCRMALVRSVKAFDEAKGRFVTYACACMKFALYDMLRSTSCIGAPVEAHDKSVLISRLLDADADLTPEQLADATGIPERKIQALIGIRRVASLDERYDDSFKSLHSVVDDGPPPDETASKSDQRKHLGDLLSQLSPREALIIDARFGFETGEPRTLEEIAEEWGLTRERIRQIETKALRRLRLRAQELCP